MSNWPNAFSLLEITYEKTEWCLFLPWFSCKNKLGC